MGHLLNKCLCDELNAAQRDRVQTQRKMQYPSEVMEVMSASIKNGIDIAKRVVDLQAGADYTVDSIVRKVPLFGSVYGWLLPDEMEDEDGAEPFNNSGVGFQIGVGIQ